MEFRIYIETNNADSVSAVPIFYILYSIFWVATPPVSFLAVLFYLSGFSYWHSVGEFYFSAARLSLHWRVGVGNCGHPVLSAPSIGMFWFLGYVSVDYRRGAFGNFS